MDEERRKRSAGNGRMAKRETSVTLAAGGDFTTLRRSKRVLEVEEKRIRNVRSKFPEGMEHHGLDVTPFVREAMQSGGKLEKGQRDLIGEQMRKNSVSGKKLSDVLPKAFVPQVKQVFEQESVQQSDSRVMGKGGVGYKGFMFTTSFVTPGGDSDDKEIPRPSSPRPKEYGKKEAHQSHTSPFSLVGPESNRLKTVWNSQWANIGVDSRIEKSALQEHNQGSEVVHFRMDSDRRSTVGYVSKTPQGGFKSVSLQYQRRGLMEEEK